MVNIVDYIPFGHENGITAEKLADLLGVKEREVRQAVHDARRETVILNMQDGNGYFRPETSEVELVNRWYRQENARLKSIGWALASARAFVRDATLLEEIKNG